MIMALLHRTTNLQTLKIIVFYKGNRSYLLTKTGLVKLTEDIET